MPIQHATFSVGSMACLALWHQLMMHHHLGKNKPVEAGKKYLTAMPMAQKADWQFFLSLADWPFSQPIRQVTFARFKLAIDTQHPEL